ncbi:MAG: TonB family protein [Minicystis sp.]
MTTAAALLAAPSTGHAASPPASIAITPPLPIDPLHADYPPDAAGEHDVLLEITVRADGQVEKARVVEGDAPFGEAAVQASTRWHFEPARQDGKPVSARIRAAIHFVPPAAPVDPPAASSTPASNPPPAAPGPDPRSPSTPAQTAAGSTPLEVTIAGGPRAPGSTSLAKSDVRLLPGAFGDPFRAVEIMPGVTPMFSGLPYFYVRGAPPGNVGYFIDGVRVPALYHLLAGPAVIPGSLIQKVDLYPGGYPAEHGRFAGGIVTGETRPPSPDFHAEGTLRLVDAGALVEAPLPGGHGSALAGARYSYTAPIVSLFAPDFRLDYWDYQGRIALELSPHDRLTVFAFGAHDYSATRRDGVWEPMFATEFHRVDLRYDARIGEHTVVQQGVTFGRDRSNTQSAGLSSQNLASTLLAARVRVEHRATDAVLVRGGVNASLESFAIDDANLGPAGAGLFESRQDLAVGFFADAVIDAGRGVQITPGVRLDLWGLQGATALSADVRLATRVPVTDRVRLISASGLAHQAPGFLFAVPGVAIGGLAGGLQKSFQTSAGVEVDLPLDIKASATLFHNAFFDLSDTMGITPARPEGYLQGRTLSWLNDRALGSATGLEIHIRRKLSERLGGFVSYTLARSTRHVAGNSFAAQFDRTHTLNAALSWDIGRGFRVGARVAVYSGMPLSPFHPAEDVALVGRDRLPPFFRLDARAEKRWIIGRGFLSIVAEVQNATVSREPTGLECTGWPQRRCDLTMFGPVTLPSLGVEGGIRCGSERDRESRRQARSGATFKPARVVRGMGGPDELCSAGGKGA